MNIPLETLSNVALIFNGKTPAKADQRIEGYPVLKIKDVSEDGFFKGSFQSFVDNHFVKKFNNKKIIVGDSLILNAAHNSDYVGSKIYKAELSVEGALATGEWTLVRSNQKELDSDYLYYWLLTGRTRHHIRQIVKGIHLYPKDVSRLKIPLPPLEEQKRIAAILDKADAIRRKRKEAIALTEELLRSTFLDMFGDIKANGWEMCKIENITAKHKGSIRTGPFGSQLLHSEFVDEGIAVLGIDNAVQNEFQWAKPRFITEEKYAVLKRYTVRPDDVIITIMGTCGRCAIVPRDCPTAINTKHLCCITLDQEKCLPEFLHSYFLIHPEARKYLKMNAKGAIMEGLNMTIINNLPVPLVPIPLQQKYKEIHQKQYKLKNKIIFGQSNDENLFNSLLQKAFRGEL